VEPPQGYTVAKLAPDNTGRQTPGIERALDKLIRHGTSPAIRSAWQLEVEQHCQVGRREPGEQERAISVRTANSHHEPLPIGHRLARRTAQARRAPGPSESCWRPSSMPPIVCVVLRWKSHRLPPTLRAVLPDVAAYPPSWFQTCQKYRSSKGWLCAN
jgi:hypothetical protein